MLSAKLEKCRCNYNLIKFKLEREIFWMNRDYKENMPELTKIQRHLSSLIDQKVALKSDLKKLENQIQSEQKQLVEIKNKLKKKILHKKAINKYMYYYFSILFKRHFIVLSLTAFYEGIFY